MKREPTIDAPGRIDSTASTGRRLWLVYWGWSAEGSDFFEVIQATDQEARNLQQLLEAGERARLIWDPWLTPLIAEKATRYEAFGYRTLRDFGYSGKVGRLGQIDRANRPNPEVRI